MAVLNSEWRTSGRSGNQGNCVQVRFVDGVVEVRNSKAPEAGTVRFTPGEWVAFIGGARDGEFDLNI